MTSKLDISNTVTDEERIGQSDLFQLFKNQETPTEYIDWFVKSFFSFFGLFLLSC